jgi:hypothetical protein
LVLLSDKVSIGYEIAAMRQRVHIVVVSEKESDISYYCLHYGMHVVYKKEAKLKEALEYIKMKKLGFVGSKVVVIDGSDAISIMDLK